MAILEQEKLEGRGIVKTFEQSALSLIMKNVQTGQYQYPIKSFIREVTSNCVDSISEKNMARAILNGEAKVEDYYLVGSEDDEFTRDSRFDKDYYDLKFLNSKDHITIRYIHEIGTRDTIEISDTGVGLGGSRLRGYFKPAYSTKRLNKKALGKFGVGAKAGLATGVEKYQVENFYNGKRYLFDVYEDQYFPKIPKFNKDGKVNPFEYWDIQRYGAGGEIVDDQLKVYYEETTNHNGVIVSMDVKNPIRNRNNYVEAVKSQLTYFDNIVFVEEWADGSNSTINHDVKDRVMYRSENLLVPYTSYYSVPHLILNNVNYGPIDFSEMELDTPKGNIGIIGDPNEVDVNLPRETVIYNDKTRDAILKYVESAKTVAQDMINAELDSKRDDFLTWIKACKSLKIDADEDSDNVIGRLACMADLSDIQLNFIKPDLKVNWPYTRVNFRDIFEGFKVMCTTVWESDGAFKTKTKEVKTWGDFDTDILFYRGNDENIRPITMGYIAETVEGLGREFNGDSNIYQIQPDLKYWKANQSAALADRMQKMYKVLMESENYLKYGDYTPPDDFLKLYKDAQKKLEEEEEKEKEKEEKRVEDENLSAEEIRKRDGKFLYYAWIGASDQQNAYLTADDYPYDTWKLCDVKRKKRECEISEVRNKFHKDKTIYFTGNELEMAKLVMPMLRLGSTSSFRYYSRYFEDVTSDFESLIMVSEKNVKYIDNYATNVKQALQTLTKEGTIKLMEPLKRFNTVRVYKDLIYTREYRYLQKFKGVDKNAFIAYTTLTDLAYGTLDRFSTDLKDPIIDYLDKVTTLQLAVYTKETNVETVKSIATDYFNNGNIVDCDVVDMSTLCLWKALQLYHEGVRPLMSFIDTHAASQDESLFHDATREYVKLRNAPSYMDLLKEVISEYTVDESKILATFEETKVEENNQD